MTGVSGLEHQNKLATMAGFGCLWTLWVNIKTLRTTMNSSYCSTPDENENSVFWIVYRFSAMKSVSLFLFPSFACFRIVIWLIWHDTSLREIAKSTVYQNWLFRLFIGIFWLFHQKQFWLFSFNDLAWTFLTHAPNNPASNEVADEFHAIIKFTAFSDIATKQVHT